MMIQIQALKRIAIDNCFNHWILGKHVFKSWTRPAETIKLVCPSTIYIYIKSTFASRYFGTILPFIGNIGLSSCLDNLCVARLVGKAEIDQTPAAKAAMQKEWDRLRSNSVWD